MVKKYLNNKHSIQIRKNKYNVRQKYNSSQKTIIQEINDDVNHRNKSQIKSEQNF